MDTAQDFTDAPQYHKLQCYARGGRGRVLALAALQKQHDEVNKKKSEEKKRKQTSKNRDEVKKKVEQPSITKETKNEVEKVKKVRNPKRKLNLENFPQVENRSGLLGVKRVYHGIQNIGNSCYMNAVLQALLNLRSFTADMESNTLRAEDFPSSSALRQLFKIMLEAKNEESNAIIDPTTFKLSIESTSAIFMGFFQQDAHEFLCNFLDQLKNDVQKNVEEEGMDSDLGLKIARTLCPVTKNFSCIVQVQMECNGCGFTINVEEYFQDFSLSIPQEGGRTRRSTPSIQIDSLVQDYFKDDVYDKKCEKCDSDKCSVKKVFKKLPRVLILHVKRFSTSGLDYTVEYNKDLSKVQLTRELNLGFLCSPNTEYPVGGNTKVKEISTGLARVKEGIPLSDISNKLELKDFASSQQLDVDPYDTKFIEQRKFLTQQEQGRENECPAVQDPGKLTSDREARCKEGNQIVKFPVGNSTSPKQASYELNAIVSHVGSSASSGHYLTDVHDTLANQWVRYDDSFVNEVSADSVFDSEKESQCYLLFYVHNDFI